MINVINVINDKDEKDDDDDGDGDGDDDGDDNRCQSISTSNALSFLEIDYLNKINLQPSFQLYNFLYKKVLYVIKFRPAFLCFVLINHCDETTCDHWDDHLYDQDKTPPSFFLIDH